MQLDLTDDQTLFRETTVRFIETELPLRATRDLHDDPTGYDRTWLRASAELGWFAMLVPEADGGGSVSGVGLLDAALIAEEIGRGMQPGPFIPMNVSAAAIATDGTAEQRREMLPGIVSGELIATWAFASAEGNWDAGAGMSVTRIGDDITLDGTRGFVQDAVSADQLLVAVTIDGQPAQVIVAADAPGVSVRPLTTLDLSRRIAHVDFHRVTVPTTSVLGTAGGEALDSQLRHAIVLNSAETVGALDALFCMTAEYAKDRTAFGRPIGSFQAIKHILADQLLLLENCKAAAVAAAKAVGAGDDSAQEVTSMVAAYIGDVANDIAQECLQVFGGIGYTWEHDLHLYLRRIRSNTATYGEPTWHREQVCAYHGLGETR